MQDTTDDVPQDAFDWKPRRLSTRNYMLLSYEEIQQFKPLHWVLLISYLKFLSDNELENNAKSRTEFITVFKPATGYHTGDYVKRVLKTISPIVDRIRLKNCQLEYIAFSLKSVVDFLKDTDSFVKKLREKSV